MKIKENKIVQIILLVAVLAVWGGALRKYLSGTEEPMVEISKPAIKKSKREAKDSSIHLLANYRDPFLDNFPVEEEPDPEEAVEPAPVEVPWPALEFAGILRNKSSQKEVALILVEGQQHLLRPGQQAAGLTLKKLYRDSVVFLREGETRTFIKK